MTFLGNHLQKHKQILYCPSTFIARLRLQVSNIYSILYHKIKYSDFGNLGSQLFNLLHQRKPFLYELLHLLTSIVTTENVYLTSKKGFHRRLIEIYF